MEGISALIMICLWAFVISAAKNKTKRNASAAKKRAESVPIGGKLPGQRVSAAAPVQPRPQTAKTPAPARAAKSEGEGSRVAGTVHTVRPLSDHAHEETSLTGFTDCPPEEIAEEKQEHVPAASAGEPASVPSYAFTREDTVRAIVFSEILSKPKALRKG